MSNELEQLGDLGVDLGEYFHGAFRNGNRASVPLATRAEGVYRILEENVVGLGLYFPAILNTTVAELRARDIALQRAISEQYREHLTSLRGEGELADSHYLELFSIIEAANAKVRDLRKLAEQYSLQKRGEAVSPGMDDPLSLRDPVPGDDRECVIDLPIQHRIPGVDIQEGRGGELGRGGDHDEVL